MQGSGGLAELRLLFTFIVIGGTMQDVEREILLSFWKVHILHRAQREPVIGQWMIREWRRLGHEVSPGTVYPLLARMEQRGWLQCKVDPRGGLRARKEYSLSQKGKAVLSLLRKEVAELYRELILDEKEKHLRTTKTPGRE
jgi:PadR family transcriptional regulator, regulatory protein PadR